MPPRLRHQQLSCPRQRGAALATAMFFLVVITLLGLAAMRAGRVDMRLALNEQSRVSALQSAQSLLEALLADSANLSVETGSGYIQNCFIAPALDTAHLLGVHDFECPTATAEVSVLPEGPLKAHAYTQVARDSVGGSDFMPVSALRRGDSGTRFRLASFTVTAGFDRTAASRNTDDDEQGNFGAAEVSQGTFVKVDTIDGLVSE